MDYLTTQEVADELEVTRGRVQQLVAWGKIPATKMGRDNFIKRSDLEEYKKNRADRPGPRPKNK